ncbi:hypothetical protein [Halobacteriovorax sp. HLS]|uniref:hypothetical protein n=1 Tax=Halobacteriovorax sp. HLS TaxID=2234000 RepID=UPI000FDA5665|nr:hypothetical protein [Halobacteriovorax sp. HLS]
MRSILILVLVLFTAFSVYVTKETNYWGAFPPFDNLNTTQIFIDLLISASLVIYLLYKNRVKTKQSILPITLCGIGTIFLGSIAILVYFIWDKSLYQDSRE